MKGPRSGHCEWFGVIALVICLGLACERPGEVPSAPMPGTAASTGTSDLDTPAEAARAVLTRLRTARAARRAHDRAAERRSDDELRRLVAHDVLLKRYTDLFHQPPRKPDELGDNCVKTWKAVLAMYLDGLQLDRLRTVAAPDQAKLAEVFVPADSPAGPALLRLECVCGSDRKWRVARIDFAPDSATSTAASIPVP